MAVIIKSLMRTNVDAGAVFKDPTGKSEKNFGLVVGGGGYCISLKYVGTIHCPLPISKLRRRAGACPLTG